MCKREKCIFTPLGSSCPVSIQTVRCAPRLTAHSLVYRSVASRLCPPANDRARLSHVRCSRLKQLTASLSLLKVFYCETQACAVLPNIDNLSLHLSLCLSVYLCIYVSTYLSMYISVYPEASLSIYLSTYLSVYLPVYCFYFLLFPGYCYCYYYYYYEYCYYCYCYCFYHIIHHYYSCCDHHQDEYDDDGDCYCILKIIIHGCNVYEYEFECEY